MVLLRSRKIALPRQVAVAVPDHADFIELFNALGGKKPRCLAGADALLRLNPMAERIAVRRFILVSDL